MGKIPSREASPSRRWIRREKEEEEEGAKRARDEFADKSAMHAHAQALTTFGGEEDNNKYASIKVFVCPGVEIFGNVKFGFIVDRRREFVLWLKRETGEC